MDLVEFLLARIAEDERRLDLPDYDVVLNSHGEVSARGDGWVTRGDCPVCGKYMFDGTEVATEEAWWDHAEEAHQRARVLAECDAKRRIVALHPAEESLADVDPELGEKIPDCTTDWEPFPCRTLCLLALPYADHADYDPEWKP